jgi:5,5'-dehydrodivanillate O-demethylase
LDERLLLQVGRRTPLGGLLRRYWQPIAAVAELADRGRKAVKLLGEDLVVYRDRSGRYGLIDQWCPHARADMSLGSVEEHGFRCQFHGWLFDEAGRCLAMGQGEPEGERVFEDVIKAYPVQQMAGLVWAYLGPPPAPPLPGWALLERGSAQIAYGEVNCNWLQLLEGALDPAYFEWVEWERGHAAEAAPWRSPFDVSFAETDSGFRYERRIAGDGALAHQRDLLWPNALLKGDQIEWFLPMDEGRTLSLAWCANPGAVAAERVPYWLGPVRDPQAQRWITSRRLSEPFLASLTAADDGLAALRRRLLEEAQAVADGSVPKGLAGAMTPAAVVGVRPD